MKKLLGIALIVVFGFIVFAPQAQAASRHKRGSVVVDKNKVVYFLGENVRYPFPSMEVFTSWGHTQKSIVKANDGDLAMPVGPVAERKYTVRGHVDEITSDGLIRGWIIDPNFASQPGLSFAVFYDTPAPQPNDQSISYGVYGTERPDVNKATGISGKFGFEVSVMDEMRDGQFHTAYVYGTNLQTADVNNTYALVSGSPITFSLVPVPASKPVINYFDSGSDGPTSIKAGESATLEWSVDDATSVTLNGVAVESYSTKVVSPTVKTTYTLVATNSTGTVSREFTIDISNTNTATARDEERIADIGSIFIGLIYSQSSTGKFPDSLQSMVPTYLESVPTPPTSSEYPCSGSNNIYLYTPSADRTNFVLRYCFETDMSKDFDLQGDLGKPGLHDLDYKKEMAQYEMANDDARRIADIRQIMTALELFYNDNNRYPASSNGIPSTTDGGANYNFYTYVSQWPAAPTPPGGSCSSSQNTYTYSQLNGGQSYSLTFCLGAARGGYSAGVRTATPYGIQ